MAITTKNEIVQEIAYELWAGMPSADRSISDNFILRKLNDKIGEAAVKSAFGTYNIDGVVCADDIFRVTYTGLTVLQDSVSGFYYFALPTQPVGLPSNRSFEIYPPANRGGVQNDTFKMIARSEVQFIKSSPPIKKVWCFVDNGNMNFIDSFNIMSYYPTMNMSVVSSDANNLMAPLNLPDDMISAVKEAVLKDLRPMIGLQDTTPEPNMDNPQPR
jgi:hypothetical protein